MALRVGIAGSEKHRVIQSAPVKSQDFGNSLALPY